MDATALKEALPLITAGVILAAVLGIWRLVGKIHGYFYTETNGNDSTKAILKGIKKGIEANTTALERHHDWSQRQLREIRRRLPPPQ